MINQDRFIYYPIDKAFKKQTKAIRKQRKKQVQGLQSLQSPNKLNHRPKLIKDLFSLLVQLNQEHIKELDRNKQIVKEAIREDLFCKTSNKTEANTFDFKKFGTI